MKLVKFFLIRTLLFVFGSPIVMNVADWPKPCSLYLGVNLRKHTEIEEERRPVAGTVGEQENQREILQLVGFRRLLLDPAPQYSMLMHLGVA